VKCAASGFGFDNPQKRLDDTLGESSIEQRGDTIRIGKEMSRMRNVSIAYTIQVPRDTEISATRRVRCADDSRRARPR